MPLAFYAQRSDILDRQKLSATNMNRHRYIIYNVLTLEYDPTLLGGWVLSLEMSQTSLNPGPG